jgi:hypothetical protein
MTQSNNTQETLKPKNQKKYTEAVNLGKKLSKTPDITKVSVATQMFELIHDEDREIISNTRDIMEALNSGPDNSAVKSNARIAGVGS